MKRNNSAPDTSVVQSGNALIAQAQHSSFYWYDCIQHQLIQNANDDTLKVIQSGAYAVIVQDSLTLCSDTSNCRMVVISGVEDFAVNNGRLIIYPNPCGEKLLVTGCSLFVNTIEVMDLVGRLVYSAVIPPSKGVRGMFEVNVETLPSGLYFIKATDDKGFSQTAKFVKE